MTATVTYGYVTGDTAPRVTHGYTGGYAKNVGIPPKKNRLLKIFYYSPHQKS